MGTEGGGGWAAAAKPYVWDGMLAAGLITPEEHAEWIAVWKAEDEARTRAPGGEA